MRDVLQCIQDTVGHARPNETNQYQKVSVLGLHWDNDKLGIHHLTDRLMRIFQDKFTTTTCIIPSENANATLTDIEASRWFGQQLRSWVT